MTFEEFKKKYSRYEFRYDTHVYERKRKGNNHGNVNVRYKVYDKYAPVTPHTNLDSREADILARRMNAEDEIYLRRVFDWLYPSKNIYGLHDD